jgi:hypothetical protein
MSVAFALLLGAVVTCESEPVGPSQCAYSEPDPSPRFSYRLQVSIRASGEDIDTLYTVSVDEVLFPDSTRPLMTAPQVRADRDVEFRYPAPTSVAAMDVLVAVSDIAANCSVVGDNPVATQLQARETVRVEFTVTCIAV